MITFVGLMNIVFKYTFCAVGNDHNLNTVDNGYRNCMKLRNLPHQ
jgi:hypothetical protein